MQTFEIPLSAQPQRFSATLQGRVYRMQVLWNTRSQNWVLDIMENDGSPFIMGIPLVTGNNLLGQYEYLGIGGALVVQTDTELDRVPDFDSLGTTGHLYFLIQ